MLTYHSLSGSWRSHQNQCSSLGIYAGHQPKTQKTAVNLRLSLIYTSILSHLLLHEGASNNRKSLRKEWLVMSKIFGAENNRVSHLKNRRNHGVTTLCWRNKRHNANLMRSCRGTSMNTYHCLVIVKLERKSCTIS